MRKSFVGAGTLLVLALVGCASKEATSLKIYVQQKLYDKAIIQGTQALKQDPNNGVIAAKKGDNTTAAVEYHLATLAYPDEFAGYYAHAGALWLLAKEALKN